MVTVYNTGTTVLIMRASGATTKLKGKELSGMLKEMSIKVNLKTIWPMATESTPT